MRYIMMIICVSFILLLSGCLDGGDLKRNLTEGNVTQSIKGQSIKLSEKGQINEPFVVLDNVKPYGYWIGNNNSNDESVNLLVYVFQSEKARGEARGTFNEHLQRANLITYPNVYEKKNIMIVYFSESQVVQSFDEQLKKTMQNM
ncbi:hypothetical protein AB1I68_00915 [Paenibacillus pabuli]|uniref:hypothetical protein n=1 Tax=Paenibacillus pabuli TaxID=1472 RepID=UPI003458985A